MNSNNRIAAKIVFPRDIVCLKNVSINTLITEMMMMIIIKMMMMMMIIIIIIIIIT